MSGPYQGQDLSNCGVGRLRVAINCGVLSVNSIDSVVPATHTNCLRQILPNSLDDSIFFICHNRKFSFSCYKHGNKL